MNIAIIDDVQQDLDALAEAAREHYDQKQISIQLHTFSSPEDFWNSYSPGSYDLIFLDIYIKQANGMDLATQLREKVTPVLLFLLPAAMLLRLPVTMCRQLIIF